MENMDKYIEAYDAALDSLCDALNYAIEHPDGETNPPIIGEYARKILGWKPIESAPKEGREIFVVCGFNVTNLKSGARDYTTDPYCVWPGDEGGWVRWPHTFPPTHWMPLPEKPERRALEVTNE